MQRNETYDLPPPALSGSGSKGTSQIFSAPGDKSTKCFRLCRQMGTVRENCLKRAGLLCNLAQ
jgi:hypothetical protein